MDKENFRKICKKRVFHLKGTLKQDVLLNQKIESFLQRGVFKNVLIFMPLSHEPNILKLFLKYRGKKNIYVPFMEGKSFKMVKWRLPIKKKRFNIKEPLNSYFTTHIDLAIVPVLGVDGDFRRVGFGKGMYDRFFSTLSYRPVIVFVQRVNCFVKERVTDYYDVQGDFYITPKEIIARGDRYVDRTFSRKFCSDHRWRCRIFHIKKSRKR